MATKAKAKADTAQVAQEAPRPSLQGVNAPVVPQSVLDGLAQYRAARTASQARIEELDNQKRTEEQGFRNLRSNLGKSLLAASGVDVHALFATQVEAAGATFDLMGGRDTYLNVDKDILKEKLVSDFIGTSRGHGSFGCQTDGVRAVFAAFFGKKTFGNQDAAIQPGFELPKYFIFDRFIYVGNNRYMSIIPGGLDVDVLSPQNVAKRIFDLNIVSGADAAQKALTAEWRTATVEMKLAALLEDRTILQ